MQQPAAETTDVHTSIFRSTSLRDADRARIILIAQAHQTRVTPSYPLPTARSRYETCAPLGSAWPSGVCRPVAVDRRRPSEFATVIPDIDDEADVVRSLVRWWPQWLEAARKSSPWKAALIRWHRPDWGLVPPAEFIPLMEETGLIAETDDWVLRQACSDRSRWLDLGLEARNTVDPVTDPRVGYW